MVWRSGREQGWKAGEAEPGTLERNVESSGKERGRKESGPTIRACAGCRPLGKTTGGAVNRGHLALKWDSGAPGPQGLACLGQLGCCTLSFSVW